MPRRPRKSVSASQVSSLAGLGARKIAAQRAYEALLSGNDKAAQRAAMANYRKAVEKFNMAENIAGKIQKGQVTGKGVGVPAEKMAERLEKPIVERIVEPGTRTPRTGTDERHKKRGRFTLNYELEPRIDPPIFVMGVLSKLQNGRLAREMGEKATPTMLIKVFKALDPQSFSHDAKARKEAREKVMHTLNQNAGAIWPELWFTNSPNESTVLNAIHARQRLAKLFTSPVELQNTINYLTRTTKFLGWLAIQNSENIIRRIREKTGPLTANKLLNMTIATQGGKNMTVFTHLKEKTKHLRKQKEALTAGQSPINSTRTISGRILEDPEKNPIPRELRGTPVSATGDTLELGGRQHPTHTSKIVTFPGPLDIVMLPNKELAALTGGHSTKLIGLSTIEQEYLRPKYEAELAAERYRTTRRP